MTIPFLKRRDEASMIGDEDEPIRRKSDNPGDYEMLDAVCDDMMESIEKGDRAMLKSALEALVEHIMSLDEEQDEEDYE